jgi:hypothetical protein
MQRSQPRLVSPLVATSYSPQKKSYLFLLLQQKLPALQQARGLECLDFLHPFMVELTDHPMTGGLTR